MAEQLERMAQAPEEEKEDLQEQQLRPEAFIPVDPDLRAGNEVRRTRSTAGRRGKRHGLPGEWGPKPLEFWRGFRGLHEEHWTGRGAKGHRR